MASKKLWLGILVMVLVFGMTVVGCDDGSTDGGGEADSWANVTSLSQLNGTWKGSYSQSMTMKEMYESEGEEWDATMEAMFGSDLRITTTAEITTTINSTAKTQSMNMKMTQAYSGSKISTVWSFITSGMEGASGVTIDNSKHTITMTQNMPTETMSDEDIAETLSSGLQINQNGTKVKLPAGMMGDGSPEFILNKQ